MTPNAITNLALFIHTIFAFYRTWRDAHCQPKPDYELLKNEQVTVISLLLHHFFRPSAGFMIEDLGPPEKILSIALRPKSAGQKWKSHKITEDYIYEIAVRHLDTSLSADFPGIGSNTIKGKVAMLPSQLFHHHMTVLCISAPAALRSRWVMRPKRNDVLIHLASAMQEKNVIKGPVMLVYADGIETFTYDRYAEELLTPLYLRDNELLGNSLPIGVRGLAGIEEAFCALLKVPVEREQGVTWVGDGKRVPRLGARSLPKGRAEKRKTWKDGGMGSAGDGAGGVQRPEVEELSGEEGEAEERSGKRRKLS